MDPPTNLPITPNISNFTKNVSILDESLYNFSTTSYGGTTGDVGVYLPVNTYVGLLIVIIFFALLGNILVILVFVFDRRLHVSSSYYILSLAVSDIITASLVMTLEVDQLLHSFQWQHSKTLCEAWTTAYLFTVPVSILTSCVASIDRWYAISRPLKYRANRNGMKHKALGVIVVVWIYSILFALIPKMGWNPPDISTAQSYCFFDIELEYSILSSVLNFIIPSFLTAFVYYFMFSAMKQHTTKRRKLSSASDYSQRSLSQKKTDRQNFVRNVKLAKSYALIGSLLIITWCPFTIVSILRNVCALMKTDSCWEINVNVDQGLLMLGYFNSAINPVVYVLRFRPFQTTIRDWLRCGKRVPVF